MHLSEDQPSRLADRRTPRIDWSTCLNERVSVDGKYFSLDGNVFRMRGTTYGTFLPRPDGEPFPDRSQVKADFAAMVDVGLNVVRTYTAPPRDVVDVAEQAGIHLLVGIHYDDWRAESVVSRAAHRRVLDRGRRAVEQAMTLCADKPSVVAVAVGNEVPGDIVRLFGIERAQEVLAELVAEVHRADPSMLVTYSNYPTTEYLRIPGIDFMSFNVFLEEPKAFGSYLARLQSIAAGIPLVITELGLAGGVHGLAAQADSLLWQLRKTDEAGCAGAFVFAWTDEWGVAGQPVEGWGFGVTEADRSPKPALEGVRAWAAATVSDLRASWPEISVVVCAYNEEARIRRCLESLLRTGYPHLDVIVCDDGSTDRTAAVCREFPFRLVELEHRGLGAARNAGLEAASGEIVAYLDADAWIHPEWPYHLVLSLEGDGVIGTGGPNLPAPDAGFVERAVAASPGGPAEVLIADDRAEHVPGCNMAFRRDRLLQIGGFDPVFRAAGDDVDICWRVLDQGDQIAFSRAAQVRHHRRNSVRGYLRQQVGYGRGERLLVPRHPHRFNGFGQARWNGVIYGGTGILARLLRPVIYHGIMGLAPFQGRFTGRATTAMAWAGAVLPLTVVAALVALVVGAVDPRSVVVASAFFLLVLLYGAAIAMTFRPDPEEPHPLGSRVLVGFLHVTQPLARAWGRITASSDMRHAAPRGWNGDRETWLLELERALAASGCHVRKGTSTDRVDLSIRVGPFVEGRLTTAVAWGWIPRHRLVVRPGRLAPVAVAGGVVVTMAAGVWGSLALASILATAAAETALLRVRVDQSIRSTTRGA
jgi:glycosyltransferase involved in cell wall biosynthesis